MHYFELIVPASHRNRFDLKGLQCYGVLAVALVRSVSSHGIVHSTVVKVILVYYITVIMYKPNASLYLDTKAL